MERQTTNTHRTAVWFKLMAIVAIICSWAIQATAQEANLPGIRMYYPGKSDENPLELKPNTKAYIYFNTGSRVVYVKARLVQDGVNLGICTYEGTEAGAANAYIDQSKPENAPMLSIVPGLFTLELYEIAYYDGDELQVYTQETGYIDSITYRRKTYNGTIVAETGLDDNIVKSYFPADSDEGVKTYTFSKPIADNFSVKFSYGYGDNMFYCKLPHTLSDDGLTMTIDLRGACRNVDTLAPNAIFVDDFGNVIAPPDYITMVIENLNCVDGSKISYAYNPTGTHEYIIEGEIYKTYAYTDITFPTPEISKVTFYDSANPNSTSDAIEPNCDMVALTIENAQYIVSAEVTFANGDTQATVGYSDILTNGATYTLAIPEAIKTKGTDGLSIALTNVTYTEDDGAQHIIKPYCFESSTIEIHNLSEIKELEAKTTVTLAIPAGVKVTMSTSGYTFIEDETAGVQLFTDDTTVTLREGDLITGKIYGTYLGNGAFTLTSIDAAAEITSTDVNKGIELTNLGEILTGEYDNRLVTIIASDELPIAWDQAAGAIMIDNIMIGVVDFIPGFAAPEVIENVTGIVYKDNVDNSVYLLLRSATDINKDLSGIESIITEQASSADVYTLSGIRVRHAGQSLHGLPAGVYIINNNKIIIK